MVYQIKRSIITHICIICAIQSLFSQGNNLVRNHNFEKTTGWSCNNVCKSGQLLYDIEGWYPFISNINPIYENTGCTSCSEVCNNGNENEYGKQPAKDGNGYIILPVSNFGANNSGVATKLKEHLQLCHRYKITLFASRGDYNHSGATCAEPCYGSFNSTCAPSRIEVKLTESRSWDSEGYDLGHYDISSTNNWSKVNSQIRDTTEDIEEKYLLIKSVYGRFYTVDNKSTFIDDIAIQDLTGQICDVSNGKLEKSDFTITDDHSELDPFAITGLSKVDVINLKIYDALGSFVREISVNNPTNKLCWDGNDGTGVEKTAGLYSYQLYMANECDDLQLGGQFIKENELNFPTPDTFPCMSYKSVTRAPKPCCKNNLTISNTVIRADPTQGNEIKYVAKNNITIGPNVEIAEGTRVILQAGNQIDFNQFFNTKTNSQLETKLEECTGDQLTNDNNSSQSTVQSWEPPSEDTTAAKKKSDTSQRAETLLSSIKVTPNPTEHYLNFRYTVAHTSKVRLTLQNINGEVVGRLLTNEPRRRGTYHLRYNARQLSPGIYLYSYQTKRYRQTGKVVVVR